MTQSDLSRLLDESWRDRMAQKRQTGYCSDAELSSAKGSGAITFLASVDTFAWLARCSVGMGVARGSLSGFGFVHASPHLNAARATVERLENAEIRGRAFAVIDMLDVTLAVFEESDLPKPHVVLGDDGAVLMEWTIGRRRIGINVEAIPVESGWYFVSLDPNSPSSASGPLSELEPSTLFRRLRAG